MLWQIAWTTIFWVFSDIWGDHDFRIFLWWFKLGSLFCVETNSCGEVYIHYRLGGSWILWLGFAWLGFFDINLAWLIRYHNLAWIFCFYLSLIFFDIDFFNSAFVSLLLGLVEVDFWIFVGSRFLWRSQLFWDETRWCEDSSVSFRRFTEIWLVISLCIEWSLKSWIKIPWNVVGEILSEE